MGNNGSFMSSGAAIAVDFNLTDDNRIVGKVYLYIQKQYVDADFLKVRVTGREKTCVKWYETIHYHEKDSNGNDVQKTRTEARYDYASAAFLDVDYIIASYPGMVGQGSYEYPFEITLPHYGLPATCYREFSGNYFRVNYTLEVRLDRHNFFSRDVVNARQFLYSGSQIKAPAVPMYIEPLLRPVRSCFCFDRGSMKLAGYVNRNYTSVSDPLYCNYMVVNNSTSRIKAITVGVYENVHLRAHSHNTSTSYALFEQRIEAAQLEGIEPVAKKDQASLSLDHQLIQAFYDIIRMNRQQINITLPYTTVNDYNGVLVKVTHTVKIRAVTPFGTENPNIAMNLIVQGRSSNNSNIATAPMNALTNFEKPANWNPVYAEVVQINYAPTRMATAPTVEQVGQGDDWYHASNGASAQVIQAQSYPTNPTYDDPSFDYLIKQMFTSYDQNSVLTSWLANPRVQAASLTPQQFKILFESIVLPYGCYDIAEILARSMQGYISCEHVYSAASAIKVDKVSFINHMAKFVNDPQNYVVFRRLGLSDYMTSLVEMSYKEVNKAPPRM